MLGKRMPKKVSDASRNTQIMQRFCDTIFNKDEDYITVRPLSDTDLGAAIKMIEAPLSPADFAYASSYFGFFKPLKSPTGKLAEDNRDFINSLRNKLS